MKYGVVVYSSDVKFSSSLFEHRFSESDGSGYCFATGEHDVSWTRSSKARAYRLEDAIRRLAKKLKVKVSIDVYEV